MRKKLFAAIIAFIICMLLIVSCTYDNNMKKRENVRVNLSEDGKAEIAMLTDIGGVDDKSYNQGIYEAVQDFADERGMTFNYYIPKEKSDYSVLESIDKAISSGAKVIVAPGYWFKKPVDIAQHKYKDVKFIVVDAIPYNEKKENSKIGENTVSILFSEQEAGFLAGYSVVMERFKNIGFMGGIKSPSVENFGYGYLQGAQYAAKKMGLEKGSIKVKYMYLGAFEESAEHEYTASSWFAGDTQVIFACAGEAGISVMKAAQKYKDKYVVGVDIDQSSKYDSVITSAIKNSKKAVYKELADIYDGKFSGGTYKIYGINKGYIYLEMENDRFTKFSKSAYDEIIKDIIEGKVEINNIDLNDNSESYLNNFEYVMVEMQF